MSQVRNLAGYAQTANISGYISGTQIAGGVANTLIVGVVANSAAVLTATGFNIVEASGKLTFKYGATVIGTLDSSGNFNVLGNVTGFNPTP